VWLHFGGMSGGQQLLLSEAPFVPHGDGFSGLISGIVEAALS